MFKSIRSVLFFSFIGLTIASFVIFALVALPSIKNSAVSQIKGQLHKESMLVSDSYVRDATNGKISQDLQNRICRTSKFSGARVTLISRDGKVLADSDEPITKISTLINHRNRPEIIQSAVSGSGSSVRYSTTLQKDMVYSAYALKDNNGRLSGFIRLSEPANLIPEYIIEAYYPFLAAFIFAVMVAIIISYIFSIILTRPVKRLLDVLEKIAGGQFPQIIMRKSWFEIGALEEKTEQMSERLSDMFNDLKFQQSRYAAVFSGMKEGVIVTDRSGRIISANAAIERIFGMPLSEVDNRSVREVVRNNEISDLIEKAGKDNSEFEQTINISAPVRASFSVYAGPVKDKEGSVLGVICVLHDITRIKELEKFRSEFIANISHELKTPLTAIRSFAETLISGAMDDENSRSKFLSKIQDHSINLSVLIDDILELSRLEAGRKKGEFVKAEISGLIEKAVCDLDYKAKAKNITISTDLAKGQVNGISDLLFRAVLNVVDNAINYTNKGGKISIKSSNENNSVIVAVKDTGIGIPAESIPRIFERFYRVDSARSRETGGTGLGLSIVKHIMEIHDGKVAVQSETGKGSIFTLIFPQGNC